MTNETRLEDPTITFGDDGPFLDMRYPEGDLSHIKAENKHIAATFIQWLLTERFLEVHQQYFPEFQAQIDALNKLKEEEEAATADGA